MNTQVVKISFILLTFYSSLSGAFSEKGPCEKEKTVTKITLDSSTFNCLWECTSALSGPHYFLIPATSCFKEGSVVSVYDGKNRQVGSITLGKIERNPVDYSKIEKIAENKPVFRNFLRISKNIKVDLLSFWETYLKLNFSEHLNEENLKENLYNWGSAEIKSLKINPDYFLVSGFGAPDAVPQVSNIDFSKLVALLKQGALTLDAREDHTQTWTLPNNIEYNVNRNLLNTEWPDSDFVLNRNMLSEKNLPSDKKTPLVVYSNHAKEYSAYNLLRLLIYRGYKNLYWYQGGSTDFFGQNPVPDIKDLSIPVRNLRYVSENINKVNFIEAASLENPTSFKRIPNTYMAKFYFDLKATLNAPIKSISDLDPVSPHLYLNFIPQEALNRMKTEEIIIYGQNEIDQTPYYVAALLKFNGYNKVSIFPGGLDEWRSAERWGVKGVYFDGESPK